MAARNDRTERRYTYGPLTFTVTGLGLFLGGPKLTEKIAALGPDELKAANREAWRQRRSLTRIANQQSNVTVYGWNDARDQAIEVADVVCRETWNRMCGRAA